MKSKVLKNLIVIICLLSVMSLFLGCANGCNTDNPSVKYEDREVGDFVVRFYEDYCEIMGTTEQGNNKKFLVIPKNIDGVRVDALGYDSLFGAIDMIPGDLMSPTIKSNAIEKVYFETDIKLYPYSFNDCNKLKKVMYPKVNDDSYVMAGSNGLTIYHPCLVYESAYGNEEGSYVSFIERANVSYYYNYENAQNDGYYWIDNYDYGDKIEFIPPEPVKEGFTFGGWYKEAACINEWDFDNDTLPEEKTKLYENQWGTVREITIYQETILYAKWI